MINGGYGLLALFCCIVPLISAGIGIGMYRHWQRYGIGGFIPHAGRRRMEG